MNNAVLTEKISDALIIKFNRPEIRSPLSVFVLNRLDELLDETAKTLEIKKIIFTGKENVFASGADLREIAALSFDAAHEFAIRGQRLMNKISSLQISRRLPPSTVSVSAAHSISLCRAIKESPRRTRNFHIRA